MDAKFRRLWFARLLGEGQLPRVNLSLGRKHPAVSFGSGPGLDERLLFGSPTRPAGLGQRVQRIGWPDPDPLPSFASPNRAAAVLRERSFTPTGQIKLIGTMPEWKTMEAHFARHSNWASQTEAPTLLRVGRILATMVQSHKHKRNVFMEILIALIGAAATILAAILPGILERSAGGSRGQAQPYAKGTALLFVAVATLSFVMAKSSCDDATTSNCGFGCSPMQVFFFLGLAGASSALLGSASSRVASGAGILAGYGSALFAVLLLAFWLMTDWTDQGGRGDDSLIVGSASCGIQQAHLLAFFVLAALATFKILRSDAGSS